MQTKLKFNLYIHYVQMRNKSVSNRMTKYITCIYDQIDQTYIHKFFKLISNVLNKFMTNIHHIELIDPGEHTGGSQSVLFSSTFN